MKVSVVRQRQSGVFLLAGYATSFFFNKPHLIDGYPSPTFGKVSVENQGGVKKKDLGIVGTEQLRGLNKKGCPLKIL